MHLANMHLAQFDLLSSMRSARRAIRALLFVGLSYGSGQALAVASESAEVIPVTVEAIKEFTFADAVKEVGKINSIDSAILNFSASEKISAIHFENGDNVSQGQVIAQLDNTKAKADLDKVKSALALAKTKLERVTDLLAKEPYALAKQDVDEMRENVNLAAADVRQK
ncbi:MAG: biotin/lipoyl-binding protein, partial [Shewanella sp.]